MGHMKNFDIRIRNGGDDAIAAVSEYVAELEGEVAAARACAEMMLQGTGQKLGEELARRVMDQRYPTKWIPVEERLPEDAKEVLIFWVPRDADGKPSCCGADGNGGLIDIGWLHRLGDSEGNHWVCESADEPFEPIAWMPLPEPPAT